MQYIDGIMHIDTYKTLVDNMPYGFSYNRIVPDHSGNPSDFVIEYMNTAFEQFTGMQRYEVQGKKAAEILMTSSTIEMDWFEAATKTALTGKSATFEQYSRHLDKWFSFCIYSTGEGFFAIILKDITDSRLQHTKLKLKTSEEKFYKAFNSSPTCISISTLDEGVYLEANATFLEVFGYDRKELIGKSSLDLNIWICNKDRENLLRKLQSKTSIRNIENRFRMKSGETKLFLMSLEKITLNSIQCVIFSLNDITARKKAEEDLKASENKLRTILSSTPDCIIVTTLNGVITECNKETLNMLGMQDKTSLVGTCLSDYIVKEDLSILSRRIEQVLQQCEMKNQEYSVVTASGRKLPIEATSSLIPHPSGKSENIVIICKDISERKQTESEIRYLSYHDKLTGLYNRTFFEEELERLDTERQLPMSVIIVDLNGLKLTNDLFGHCEGDNLLQKVASILRNSCRKEDIIARWGGDEFAIILPKTQKNQADEVCNRITSLCSKADKGPIQLSIALGHETKENTAQDIQQIIKEAENCMYRHKLLDNRSVRNSIIASLEKTLFERNYETEEHAQRIKLISMNLGKALGLSSNEMDELNLLSILHDIGKIAVPDDILTKPGKLTCREWNEMKKHAEVGYRIAKSSHELSHIAEYILSHHERWDGNGYPRGLKGDEIPKLARIISLVDAYDVMTNIRPYKGIMSHDDAVIEIRKCSGTQFDPHIADAFLGIVKEL